MAPPSLAERIRQMESALAHLRAHIPTLERDLAEIKRLAGLANTDASGRPADCLCGVSAPDSFGNRDLLVHSDCPYHAGVEATK